MLAHAKNSQLWIIYIGKVCKRNSQRQRHETVLALATLGDVTRNRSNPICVVPPKVPKARTMVTVTCRCHQHYCDNLCQCKYSFRLMYIGNGFLTKMSVTETDILFALATLSDATQIGSFLFVVSQHPRWLVAKASCKLSMVVTVACRCCWCYRPKLRQWKHGFKVENSDPNKF